MMRLNIRQKIILGLVIMCVANGILAAISYSGLMTMREKIKVVEFADDLSNTILEIRRSEKNYLLLYGENNLEENRNFVDAALSMLANAPVGITDKVVATMLGDIEGRLTEYRALVELLSSLRPRAAQEQSVEAEVREIGKSLIEQSKLLANYERRQIISITNQLQKNLVTSVIFILLLAVGLFFFVTFKILLPLKVVEQTTAHIAEGDFQPLPVWNTHDEIQRLMEAFNRMVRELENRQDQLVQAQKLSSIGTLASGIAHQLNNPLNNISTSCQIVLEENGTLPDFSRKMLTNIEQETIRARDIVRGLLEFSRNQEFNLQSVPLKDVVQRSIKLVSSQIPAEITLEVEVADDIRLNLDVQRMSECLINLLLNARQAIKGSGRILVYSESSEMSDCVALTVEDTGEGIPEKDLNRIFDPFYTTKGVSTGTGLGLYVVYGIVNQHHGKISAESVVGQGTRFIINLPLSASGVCEKRNNGGAA